MPAGCTSFRASSTSTFTSTSRGGPIGKAGQPARPPARSAARRPWPRCLSTPIRRPSTVRPSTPSSKAAEASSRVDFALWGGLTPVNLDRMEELAGRGVIGFKAFMSSSGIDDFPAADDATLFERDATRGGARVAGRRARGERRAHRGTGSQGHRGRPRSTARDYLASRPAIAEIEAIARAILFAEETGCALHVVHVSTGRGIAEIAAARARGVDVTAETCPHYLVFDEEDLRTARRDCQVRSAPAAAVRGRPALASARPGRYPDRRLRSLPGAGRHEDRR